MAQAFAFPSYPPIGPWELYIGLLIWIPALMRLLLLSKPGYLVIKAFMPDKALPLRKIFEWWKELPIKGVGVFLLNEIIMFVTIPIVAFSFRVFSDPIGWQTWEETSQGGVIFIILGFSLWVIYDIFLILKSRRILKVLARKDIEKITFIADYIMKGRRFLRGVAKPVLGVDEKGEDFQC